MTPDELAALRLLTAELGARPVQGLVRAKCPRCRRWCLRARDTLTTPCYLCTPVDGFGTFFDLLLALENRLSAAAYARKLERDGPPWVNLAAWTHPKKSWPKLPRPTDT